MSLNLTSRAALMVVGCGLLATATAAQKIEIKSEKDPKADFTSIQTYRWLDPPPAIKTTAPDAATNPNLTQEVLGPHITSAVDRELTARGLKRVDAADADVQVVYYAVLNVGMDSKQLGSYYGYTTGWALPLGPAPTTSMRIYERGTIIVDVVSPTLKSAIWRGSAATDVAQAMPLKKRIERINQAMKRMFERFPVPVGKR